MEVFFSSFFLRTCNQSVKLYLAFFCSRKVLYRELLSIVSCVKVIVYRKLMHCAVGQCLAFVIVLILFIHQSFQLLILDVTVLGGALVAGSGSTGQHKVGVDWMPL